MQLSPVSGPSRRRVAAAVAAVAVLASIVAGTPAGITASPVAAQDAPPIPLLGVVSPADGPASERHGRSELDAELVSRTFDPTSGTYEIQVRATLDSRALCLPVAFDCILEPETDPVDAELVDIDCPGPLWNHLGFFTDVCLKQFFTAGLDQQFLLTYQTLPGSAPDSVTLPVRFGRGLFPIMLQELARTELTVALDAQLDVTTTCPADTVDAGDPIDCTLSVAFPDTPDAIPVAVAEIAVEPTPGALVSSPTLTAQGAPGSEWSCAPTGCTLTGSPLQPGDVVEFAWSAAAATTPDGGELTLDAVLTWPVDRTATATDNVAIAGSTDTELTIAKSAVTERARPGGTLDWVVTVENVGVAGRPDALDARNVVLTDAAARWITDLVVTPIDGVGDWTCSGSSCTTDLMPSGVATFAVAGRLAQDAPVGAALVNQVDVVWENDVFGPGVPAVAGATITVEAVPEPPAPTPAATTDERPPASLAFTG